MSRYRSWRRLIDLLLIFAGFGAALLLYNALLAGGLTPKETYLSIGSSVVAFWVALQLKDWGADADDNWDVAVEQFCFGTGVNLLVHALMTYGFQIRRTPFLIVAGSLFSAILLAVARHWGLLAMQSQARILLVGFDAVTGKIVAGLKTAPLGLIGSETLQPGRNIPFLGDLSQLEEVVRTLQPTHLIVSQTGGKSSIELALLLKYRLAGMTIQQPRTVYEKLFARVCCERLQPIDLLLTSALRGDARTMAIQAVYTNLIALFFLLLLSPLLALFALATALSSGGGPVFDNVECAGFQYIPFRLLRFRTTGSDGGVSRLGRIMIRLRIVNLPQLINVVRGDMALIGPSPVRREFARYLSTAMPFYSHRFSVKPGLIGWARLHASRYAIPDECQQVEYDLYYVKQGSVWLDLEIFTGMMAGRVKEWRGAVPQS